MTDQKPDVRWQAVSGTFEEVGAPLGAGEAAEVMWWEQPLRCEPDAIVWVGAQRAAWLRSGRLDPEGRRSRNRRVGGSAQHMVRNPEPVVVTRRPRRSVRWSGAK